ncbi:DegT/DnrJ/EryC1/StrS family aminotransferase [Pseudomonas gingeri]
MSNDILLYKSVNIPEMESAAIEVLRSGRISSGEYVDKFEKALGVIVGSDNVVSTIDMTAAMFLALHLSEVGEGDEVLTLAFCCLSTTSAIAQRGAKPVWVDVRPGTVEMDIDDLCSKITSKTKAVIVYHVAGYPSPAEEIYYICKKNNISLIEDCNNSIFSSCNSVPVGKQGDFAVYSFYPNRQINTSEGGALTCRDPKLASKARKLRRFGIDPTTFRNAEGEISELSDIPEVGWSITLNNLCAAMGCAQLSSLPARQKIVEENARHLKKLIEGFEGVRAVPVLQGAKSAYWVFLVFSKSARSFIKEMRRQGVMASGVHLRNDLYSGFASDKNIKLENTSYLQKHLVGVPCGWWLNEKDIQNVAIAIEKAALLSHMSLSESNL